MNQQHRIEAILRLQRILRHSDDMELYDEMEKLIQEHKKSTIISASPTKVVAEGTCNLSFNEGWMMNVGGIADPEDLDEDPVGGYDLDQLVQLSGHHLPKKVRITVEILDGEENQSRFSKKD